MENLPPEVVANHLWPELVAGTRYLPDDTHSMTTVIHICWVGCLPGPVVGVLLVQPEKGVKASPTRRKKIVFFYSTTDELKKEIDNQR